jgi:AcrR family transcriptional regulator
MSITKPQQARSERTLEKILAACDRLLAERSFEQISMQDIASEAGISVGNLYNRFSDKNGLIDHVLASYQLRFMDDMRGLLAADDGKLDTAARLAVIVEQVSAGISSLRPVYTTMATRRARGEEPDPGVKAKSLGLIDLFTDWLLAGDPALDARRCRFALATITSSLQFDLLFGTQQRMFGEDYQKQLVEQALCYLSQPDINHRS